MTTPDRTCTYVIQALWPYTEEAMIKCGEPAVIHAIHFQQGPEDERHDAYTCKPHSVKLVDDTFWDRVHALTQCESSDRVIT